jgi:C4-type Zn-finger protein
MIIIAASDITCPVCKAGPGERCTYVSNAAYRGEIMRRGAHNRRVWDADAGTRMANLLVGT